MKTNSPKSAREQTSRSKLFRYLCILHSVGQLHSRRALPLSVPSEVENERDKPDVKESGYIRPMECVYVCGVGGHFRPLPFPVSQNGLIGYGYHLCQCRAKWKTSEANAGRRCADVKESVCAAASVLVRTSNEILMRLQRRRSFPSASILRSAERPHSRRAPLLPAPGEVDARLQRRGGRPAARSEAAPCCR